MPIRRRPSPEPPDSEDTLAYIDLLLARADRVADRIEAYVEDPADPEGHHDDPPAA